MVDELQQRCADLESSLALAIKLGRSLEFQRDCFVRASGIARGLLDQSRNEITTQKDRLSCIAALDHWLGEIANNAVPPLPWPGEKPPARH
ncbi:hypothetical protein [Bradyrhizobium diazoefficiens]|uniref:hypothetical protein n=1 Tax=Bradyrhizobium diazoefficiens TaxID=1355477 RepID=UPI00272D127D|nr:hypothetical protein [Bradyrhizobium diazoefficiens]WLA62371.1 hypothetical protein QNN01_28315 [Bradyrhizobium diazoefficiens]